MIDDFNAQSTLATVELEFRPGDQYWDKIQTEFAGGQAPDITLNQIDWLVPGASRGMFVDLKPYYERDEVDLSDLWYDMEQEWGYEGGMYGALLYAGGQALYYNKDLLEAAGEAAPAADWTWDDLLASAQKLTNEAEGIYGVTLSNPNPPYWGCAFIHGAGGTVLNDARDECTLNSPEARAALQWLVDLTFTHKVAPVMVQEEGMENPFLTGKVAYYFGGTWEEAAIPHGHFDWDFLHMPAHPETGVLSVQMGSNAWSILSTTEQRRCRLGSRQVPRRPGQGGGRRIARHSGLDRGDRKPGIPGHARPAGYLDPGQRFRGVRPRLLRHGGRRRVVGSRDPGAGPDVDRRGYGGQLDPAGHRRGERDLLAPGHLRFGPGRGRPRFRQLGRALPGPRGPAPRSGPGHPGTGRRRAQGRRRHDRSCRRPSRLAQGAGSRHRLRVAGLVRG